jgi:Polymorphic toxin system, DSP-PTPase phosphatase
MTQRHHKTVTANPYWINQQIAIVPRPKGEDLLVDEMHALREAGIDVVASMLEENEATQLGLQHEQNAAEQAKIIFINFPIPVLGVPLQTTTFAEFLVKIEEHLAAGRRVGIHCQASIGRSSVVATSLLIRSGISIDEAWTQTAIARGTPVPDTPEQRSWVNTNIQKGSSPVGDAFPHTWAAEVLKSPPLITPARHFTYPRQIAGEEDALARGALQLLVRPAEGGAFLATCALGFTNATMPSGVLSCPNPSDLCAVAGGYAYIIDTLNPERSTHISLKPVVSIHPIPSQNLILFAGFRTILGWGTDGEAWHSNKLSWEGIRITGIQGHTLHGTGWDLLTDRELPFALDLRTGLKD